MDASTLKLHRHLLRLAKGGLKHYQEWIEEQGATLVVESLKEQKADRSQGAKKDIATRTESL